MMSLYSLCCLFLSVTTCKLPVSFCCKYICRADSINTSKAFCGTPSTVHCVSLVVVTSYLRNRPNEEITGITGKLGSTGSNVSLCGPTRDNSSLTVSSVGDTCEDDGNLQVVTERNRQHKLYNDIIKQLTSQGLSFKADEVDTSGTKLVRLLCDILWHIDSHASRFSVKVCSNSYRIWRVLVYHQSLFLQLHHLPLPIPSEDGHCLSFAEVFCEKITGEHRPSLLKKPSKSNSLPFYASVQHVKNCQMVIQCENCDLWRIIFSKYKLKPSQKQQLATR